MFALVFFWYLISTHVWIQLQLPSKLGRLPSLIGEPAGGSLTADQWMVFTTVVAPLAVDMGPFLHLHSKLTLAKQILHLWQDYLKTTESPEQVVAHRTAAIAQNLQKRDAAREQRAQAQHLAAQAAEEVSPMVVVSWVIVNMMYRVQVVLIETDSLHNVQW